ncbi:hypothetical protein [Synechococcus sp. CBW1006]|uniref:hypothetical protein n=1 Tax=Synechococcus sp. CBW1006 TaxID=1353138 RepID=UPI0018CE3A8E|nr:hypothetical protein [Synechococcus sp. CBW1006]QPN67563.1 hypothetical protein H8F26_05135 [Synechococcus sp. CBW1006]
MQQSSESPAAADSSPGAVIDWAALGRIRELEEYFSADAEGFQAAIRAEMATITALPAEQLDKLALLRVLEVTNGCLQWGFRRGDAEALSADRTRDCMRTVIGFINDRSIILPDGGRVSFSPAVIRMIGEGQALYREAFKRNDAEARRRYFAASTAQFLVYGKPRMEAAMEQIATAFEPLFERFWLERGQRWIRPYLAAQTTVDSGS